MVLMKFFNSISSKMLVIASQKLVSQIVLTSKSIHNNRDMFDDEIVLIFFMNTIVKAHVKRLPDRLCEFNAHPGHMVASLD